MQRLWNWGRILSSGAPAPGCTVTVYAAGTTTLSTIFSDNISTPKANPFTADATTGYWFFYASAGRYDVKFSGTGITSPYTLSDVTLFDPTDGFIQSLNAQFQATQTLVAGTAGTDFAVSSAAGVHTLNLPNAGAASRGVVSTGAQTFAGVKTFSTPIAAGSGGTGVDGSAAANGRLLTGNGAGFTLANLTQAANLGVTITNGAGSIALGTVQDIRTTGTPTFFTLNLTENFNSNIAMTVNWPVTDGGVLVVEPGAGIGERVHGIRLVDGQVPLGQTGGSVVAGNLVNGLGISMTQAAGDLTVTNTGILSLKSSAGAALTGALTLAVGSAGTDVAISPTTIGATTITLNVPDASATARGVITTAAQSITGSKTFLNPVLAIPGSAAASTTPGRASTSFLRDLAGVSSVGAAETTLGTVTLPSNALDTDFFSAANITCWGTVAANANSKTLRLYFGSVVIATLSNATTFNNMSFWIQARVARKGVGNQEVIAFGYVSAANTTVPVGITVLRSAPTETLSSAVIIKYTGQGVSNADIIGTGLMVEVIY